MIHGDISPGYEPIAEAFQSLFERYGEIGAGLCLIHQGEVVVDLWGGSRTKSADQPWQADTRSNIFSASKPFVAVALLQLIQRGVLRLDDPIASIWPEFGANGKEAITLRQVLSHRSGINAFHQRVADGIIYDWKAVTDAIAAESPWWTPGTEQGYSPMIFGWLLGEVVCRAAGVATFDDYIRENIAGPVGINVQFGLTDEQVATVADLTPLSVQQAIKGESLVSLMRADPRGVANRAFSNPSSMLMGTNQPAWRKAQIPAANGQASARDLSAFYASLADVNDSRLLSAPMREHLWTEQSYGHDKILNNPLSISLGFMRLLPDNVIADRHFCHPGAGGSLGFGDADLNFGFGFVTRGMGQAVLLDERAEYLLQTVYAVIRGEV